MPVNTLAMKKQFKFLNFITVLYVTMQLVCDVTASKLVQIGPFPVSITVVYFPLTYIFADILTEVYGYGQARKALWIVMLCSVLACMTYQVVIYMPPAPVFQDNEAYLTVFNKVPRVLVGSWVAVFAGEIFNNFLLAKMKVWTNGSHLWSRLIGSTVAGQFVNTALFYSIAFFGVFPSNILVESIFSGWFLKVVVEILLIPVTYLVVGKLKQVEHEDYFDRDTDFNPFVAK